MHALLRYCWRTLVDGVLLLAPLLIIALVIQKAIELLAKVLAPIANHLPMHASPGMDQTEFAAVIVLLLLGISAGIIAQTPIAKRFQKFMEHLILSKLPGYTLFKVMAEGTTGEENSSLEPALANIDDAWLLAFIVERHGDGMFTVFVPSAPTPTAGTIYFLNDHQIRPLDIPIAKVVQVIKQLGKGSSEIFATNPLPKA